MKIGCNTVFPVALTERGVSAVAYGTVIAALKAVPYSFSFQSHYEILAARTLRVGSLVNPSGHVVHPSKDTVLSAVGDFSSEETDLLLGM